MQKYNISSALASEEARLRLFFDPDDHPENTLKAFQEFIQRFELRYDGYPPKISLEAAIERWKILEATLENPSPKANLIFANTLKHTTKYEIFWESIHQGDYTRTGVWLHQRRKRGKMHSGKILFITNSAYYKPTENLTLKHFHFRSNIQKYSETFIAFYNRVLLEAEQRNFKCTAKSCAAEDTAVRGQICQEILKKSWDLDTLQREGMKMERAARGGAEINGEDIYKMGAFSFKSLKDK